MNACACRMETVSTDEVVNRIRQHFAAIEPAYAWRVDLAELCQNYTPAQLRDALDTWLSRAESRFRRLLNWHPALSKSGHKGIFKPRLDRS